VGHGVLHLATAIYSPWTHGRQNWMIVAWVQTENTTY
jgi:hypothetical protein